MALLLSALIAHVVVARIIPSPWWVPDLSLVGLVLAIVRAPTRWLVFSGVALLCPVVWAIRCALPILISYVVVGWLVYVVATQWDATDLRVQVLLVSLASVLTTMMLLWLDEQWSLALLGSTIVRVAMTTFAFVCARWLLIRWRPHTLGSL